MAQLLLSGDGTVQLQYEVTRTDKDGDHITVADQIDLIDDGNSYFSFDDDGPTLTVIATTDVQALGALGLNVDETEGTDRQNPPEVADGNTDDAGPGLGQVTTAAGDPNNGGLKSLFAVGGDAGSDKEASLTGTLSFHATQGGLLATNLVATDGGAIALDVSATTITGKDANGAGDTVFTIEIVDTGGGNFQLVLTQFEAIKHTDNNLFDSVAQLLLSGDGTVQLQYEVTRTDKDGDHITLADQIDLIDDGNSYFSFDDDGPTLTVAAKTDVNKSGLFLNVDETEGSRPTEIRLRLPTAIPTTLVRASVKSRPMSTAASPTCCSSPAATPAPTRKPL